ncbi:hypothetical protein PHLCEN_2v12117 [Hermanssonia centrifuga]|uniref:Uncharacterized protein n=1 Tax=Hermanssonia centrifuga TaxID=98765 RepID=A0A2R6NI60_9APHY|nr:hypothetical protein PHLCEN_2v12117 [Hermanssonia centrifuga]
MIRTGRIEGNDDDGDTPQKLGSGPDSKSEIKELTELIRLSIILASQYRGPSSLVINEVV